MNNMRLSGAIFGIDSSYTYSIRNKCSAQGIEIVYLCNLHSLLFYILNNPTGMIFLGKKYTRYVPFLTELSRGNIRNAYSVICLDETKSACQQNSEGVYVTNIDNLDKVLPIIKSNFKVRVTNIIDIPKNDIYKYTSKLLAEFGISCKHVGYTFIRECVCTALYTSDKFLHFSKQIYPLVAFGNNTTVSNIEKSIRCAIKKAYQSSPQLFDVDELKNKKVSNAEFLSYLIERIKILFLDPNGQSVAM